MLTKTKFVEFINCNKYSWLKEYKPELDIKESSKSIDDGILVGELARNIFGKYVLIDSSKYDQNELIRETKKYIENETNVICEATFKYMDALCKVDILKKNDDNTYSIYEVKASSYKDKIDSKYIYDIAYQRYILDKSLVDIKDTNLVLLDSTYIKDKELDLNKLFKIINVDNLIKDINIEKLINEYYKNLDINDEPSMEISKKCQDCKFNEYCYESLNIPKTNSVLNLYNNRSKYKFIKENIITFNDLYNSPYFKKLDLFNQRMIDFRINNKTLYFDKVKLTEFINNIKFPIYFFDFETYQKPIPEYDNSWAYEQITFQYSLHIMDANYNLVHKEFLGDGFNDPREALKNQMLIDLGDSGSIVAYNQSFEKTRIKELASIFKDDKDKLDSLQNRFIDLAIPFQNGYYYNHLMNRTSIKDVLPAIFPDDPELDYHNLEDVHKGDEASNAYISLKTLDNEQYNKLRRSLLNYCKLDTYAMVKIYLYLVDLIKNN